MIDLQALRAIGRQAEIAIGAESGRLIQAAADELEFIYQSLRAELPAGDAPKPWATAGDK